VKIVYAALPVVLLGLLVYAVNLLVFAGSLPLTTNPQKYSEYRQLGAEKDIRGLLAAERIFAKAANKNATLSEMKEFPKVFTGDVVYAYDNYAVYTDVAKRPFKYVSFNRIESGDNFMIIVGQQIKNKDGSVAYLHYGFGDETMKDEKMKQLVTRQLSDGSMYIVPVAKVADCSKHKPAIGVCEKMDKDLVWSAVTKWVQTGNVPKELEQILLVPYFVSW
jgi:hypothetical protein